MTRDITIEARWDNRAKVWLATSADVPGLVIEAETWPAMIEETRAVLPDLLELQGAGSERPSLTFRAKEHLGLGPETPSGNAIRRVVLRRSSLDELLEGVTPQAMRDAFDWGPDRGREVEE